MKWLPNLGIIIEWIMDEYLGYPAKSHNRKNYGRIYYYGREEESLIGNNNYHKNFMNIYLFRE